MSGPHLGWAASRRGVGGPPPHRGRPGPGLKGAVTGLFKSDEEKAAEEAQRQAYVAQQAAARAAADQARKDAAYAATPIGQATLALQQGLPFVEVQLEVGRIQGEASFGATSGTEQVSTSHLAVLGQIEDLGWRLEHVGYVFVMTGESSTDKFVMTGQQTAITGKTVGIYLFRRLAAASVTS